MLWNYSVGNIILIRLYNAEVHVGRVFMINVLRVHDIDI